MPDNMLYYGDNLEILRRYIRDESVDLVYLDPPFNSNATYNVLFGGKGGERAAAQVQAFGDTWHWDESAARTYQETVEGGGAASEAMQAFRRLLNEGDMMAYLAMMAPRLIELRRVLKPTGSLYLHCDPTAGHYLKVLMDAVFGPRMFRTEIVWQRSFAHNDTAQGRAQHGHIHDLILFYSRGDRWTWNPVWMAYEQGYMDAEYRHVDPDGRHYKQTDLTAAKPGGDTSYEWHVKRQADGGPWGADLDDEWQTPRAGWEYLGVRPYSGRYWAYSRENLTAFAREGRLHHRSTGIPRLKQYADEMPGIALQDLWIDIPPLSAKSAERLGYPTQKPLALLERIIQASSNPGDLVLDPFCGCGTTIAAAQGLGRRWVGIDITYLAITLIRTRLRDAYGSEAVFKVIGEPTAVEDAAELAETDPYQFQYWALGLVGARPAEQKKGADKGIDGRLYFHDDRQTGATKQVIFSVKAGHTGPTHVRDLVGVLDREKAQIGVLISLQEPTRPMRQEAASAGFYLSPWDNRNYPRVQLVTVAELLDGRGVQMPAPAQLNVTYQRAERVKRSGGEQPRLMGG